MTGDDRANSRGARRRRRAALGVAGPVVAALVTAGTTNPVPAQTLPPPGSTEPPTTAPTTTRPPTTSPTTAPGTTPPETTTAPPTTAPKADDPSLTAEDVDGGVVPGQDVAVPAAAPGATIALPDVAGLVAADRARLAAEVARLTAARDAAVAAHDRAAVEVLERTARRDELDRRYQSLTHEQRINIARLKVARRLMAQRALEAYVRGTPDPTAVALSSADLNELGIRRTLLRYVLDADVRSADDYQRARRKVGSRLRKLVTDREAAAVALRNARRHEQETALEALGAQQELSAMELSAAGGLFVFPVAEPYTFRDSFGDPRLPGTAQAHSHKGTDIMASEGTWLFAVERGVITRMSNGGLGGIAVWLKGESGTSYYYAHLSAYVPNLAVGQVVEPGSVLGFVGHTGDATGPHLHFEIHPGGGPAVDPYPWLKALDDLAHDRPVTPTTSGG